MHIPTERNERQLAWRLAYSRELSLLFTKMKEPENPEKNTRLRESVEEDYGYPLYPERKNPELYKEYTMIGRRSVKVIEKQTVKCFTHCESEFPRRQHRVLFSSVANETIRKGI